ncbi:MAG: HAMP domain-containing histidine kinase [Hamadaea sp.]|uniref:sensor histidine kinase n=1 Tax=Hamadaea sp. TaxID=2024425 RepID=UPI00184CE2C6|nr:HAMP domain-containing sensor histidine kinase [Hamadaea sp.]NUR73341.1 HAMP domain-containing histidine kinase [Hamadaea sp.]NUT21291.1 HAMP domain-containing histidine kinase [Hamadaea sp.]
MSFRLRVLLLTLVLVATSSAATAWLTLQQANRALTSYVAASHRDVEDAVAALSAYGRTHQAWTGVAEPVRDLAGRLNQRIRVVDDTGAVLADSDVLAGRAARPTVGAPSLVDARPTLNFPPGSTAYSRFQFTAAVADSFWRGRILAACAAESGLGVRVVETRYKPQIFEIVGGTETIRTACSRRSKEAHRPPGLVDQRGKSCLNTEDATTCLSELLNQDLVTLLPHPVQVYLGALDEVPAEGVPARAIALAATAVVLVTAVCAVLLSRRVLRPIGALTAASRELAAAGAFRELAAAGRPDPVPVTGHDELAELARAFNRMAGSLAASEEQQRRLIADVAHELRTPLANLRGYLEALSDGVLRPSPELFASLHEEALLQQRIVDDLQDLALAEAGVLAYHRSRVDLAELAETVRTAHSAVAEAAGLALDLRHHAEVTIDADSDRLRQVLGNLIRNAIAATASGGRITLTISADSATAYLEVRDTGRGIAPADLTHVFDRLWRGDPARGRGGTGLGLAIARQIVSDHGGRIDVVSTVGVGTAFTVSLPR